MLLTAEVASLDVCGSARVVRLANGSELSAHSVLLSTGVAYRRLTAPGVEAFTGSGVYYGAATTEAQSCRNEDVYIVGGANSAGQAAVFFAPTARSVTLMVRGPGLERSMSHYLIQQIAELPNVHVRTCSEVVGASGSDHLERLRIADLAAGTEEEVEASWLFVFIGAAPCTDWLGKEVLRDDNGFVLTGPDLLTDGQLPADWPLERHPYYLETSVPGVFAAGDVRGQSVKRVASAVGEGAMAVTLVHRYLELL
jgi:thioredoxin reductase (NADPH)